MRGMMIALVAAGMALQPEAVEAQVMVVSDAVQEQTASPGETYRGVIRLRNTGPAPTEVRVYQTGYLFHADGRAEHMQADSQPRSNATWLRLTPASLVLGPNDEADVSYSVTVPAEVAGTHWSMVMIEPLAKDAPELSRGEAAVGVRTVVRYGVQVATHVRGDAPHRLSIENARVGAAGTGEREFAFVLANEGTAGYRPNVSVEVFDAAGTVVATLEAQRGLLYPGTSTMQRFTLPSLTPGTYEAFVVVDTGDPVVFGAQIRLNLTATR